MFAKLEQRSPGDEEETGKFQWPDVPEPFRDVARDTTGAVENLPGEFEVPLHRGPVRESLHVMPNFVGEFEYLEFLQ